jgi:hypothetical protein
MAGGVNDVGKRWARGGQEVGKRLFGGSLGVLDEDIHRLDLSLTVRYNM